MANAGPNSNGSQFFMIYGDASALTPAYTVFGYIDPAGLQCWTPSPAPATTARWTPARAAQAQHEGHSRKLVKGREWYWSL